MVSVGEIHVPIHCKARNNPVTPSLFKIVASLLTCFGSSMLVSVKTEVAYLHWGTGRNTAVAAVNISFQYHGQKLRPYTWACCKCDVKKSITQK